MKIVQDAFPCGRQQAPGQDEVRRGAAHEGQQLSDYYHQLVQRSLSQDSYQLNRVYP